MAHNENIEEQERGEEYVREQFREDSEFMLQNPRGRRMLRFILGEQVTNLLGHNSEERAAAVMLVNSINMSLSPGETNPPEKVMTKLFASKEEDEHGWR